MTFSQKLLLFAIIATVGLFAGLYLGQLHDLPHVMPTLIARP